MLHVTGGQRGGKAEFAAEGEIKLLGVAAGSFAYVRFFHDFGICVNLLPTGVATVKPLRRVRDKRQNVTLVSEGPFVMKDPIWYENVKKQASQSEKAPP
jgi:hypothetical protein